MKIGPVSRGEFDMLAQRVQQNYDMIRSIDEHGTRGVGALVVQVTDLAGKVGDLRVDLATHEQEHKTAEMNREAAELARDRDRRNSRRWRVGAVIAATGGLGGLVAVIGLLLEIAAHLG